MPAGNEHKRQAYLQEMGIGTWYPRFVLPHAPRRSKGRDEPVAPGPEAVAEEVAGVDSTGTGAADPHAGLRPVAAPITPADLGAAASPALPAAPVTDSTRHLPEPPVAGQTSEADFAAAAAPYFAFAYLPVSDKLAVIVEIPYANRGRLQPPHRVLLTRILEALSVPVRSGATPVIHFQWPLHEGDHLESNLESARQVVQGFLGRQLQEHPVACVLVFSDTWPEYLFPAASTVPGKDLLAHPTLPVEVLVTHSLQSMLDDESLKRPVWAQLQPLKARLGTLRREMQ